MSNQDFSREVVSVRLDPQVIADLRNIANARGTTVSQLLREGAVAAAKEPNLMTIEWITPPTVVTDHGRSVTFTAPNPLLTTLDAAIAAQQDVIRQLERARSKVLGLVDRAIDAYTDEVKP